MFRRPLLLATAVLVALVLVPASLAAVVLKERVTVWRFAGACLVAGGIALLA